ncbi:MAG: type II CAAX endopeptidase family protein [Nitrososphaerota archaeon]
MAVFFRVRAAYVSLPATILGLIVAFPLWYFTFNTDLMGGFWNRMVLSVSVLGLVAFLAERREMARQLRRVDPRVLFLGVLSGLFLYILFYGGYSVLRPFLERGASSVYLLIGDAPAAQVAATLFYTSFCEEFFWRGFIQRNIMGYLGGLKGFLIATALYTLIHLLTLNMPLMLAALIAGFWWGLLYMLMRSLWLNISSHVIWTELVILLLPLK